MRYLRITALLALVGLCTGCGLSPQQQKAYGEALASKQKLVKTINTLEGRLVAYKADAEAIFKKLKAKDIPWAEAAPLIAKLTANVKDDKAALLEARDAAKTLGEDISKLKKLKIPWYYYIGPIVTGLLGIFGGYLPGARKAGAAGAVLSAVVSGVERADDEGTKESILAEAEMAGVEALLHRIVRRNV